MTDWTRAACRGMDTDLFFPDVGDWTGSQEAKAVCAGCPVREDCLQVALGGRDGFGVWGGLSERERRPLLEPCVRSSPSRAARNLAERRRRNPDAFSAPWLPVVSIGDGTTPRREVA